MTIAEIKQQPDHQNNVPRIDFTYDELHAFFNRKYNATASVHWVTYLATWNRRLVELGREPLKHSSTN